MDEFLIIDGNSIMNRAFYGVPYRSMSLPGGLYTNALYGFLNTYLMIKDMIKPDFVAVSFDLKAKTFRHEMYEDYKGTRKGMPEELKCQMPLIKDILRAMNIKILELETYEADDILGTVSKKNESNNIFTYILTGDRDSFQLISKTTTIVMPSTKAGKTDYLMYDENLLNENYGIIPSQIIDVKALMGDTSDNIPGVKGIGEKTAYDLIHKYNTLDNIYANISNLNATPKVIEKLQNGKEDAYMSYKLATIYREVPIDINYDECKLKDINKKELYSIFTRLKFSKLMSRFDFSGIDEASLNTDDSYVSVDEKDLFALNLNKVKPNILKEKEFVYIDADSKHLFMNAINNTKEDITYYLNIANLDYFNCALDIPNDFLATYIDNKIYIVKLQEEEFKKEILKFFAESDNNKLGYNIKQDIRYLLDIGITNFKKLSYDIMIAYYLIDSSKGKYPFSFLLAVLFAENLKEDENKEKQISMFDDMMPKEEKYISDDMLYNLSIYLLSIYESKNIILDKLNSLGMLKLFEEIEIPLSETLASMEHIGMYIDVEKLDAFDSSITERIKELEQKIYSYSEEQFNINSTKQLGELLFEELKLPVIKKTKSGYSTDKEVLEELENEHEIIPYLLEYRQISKLKSTYVDGLRPKIKENGRVHTTFMQTVTATGRLSSIEPNLQNIPVRLELGSKIRTFFVGEKDKLLLDSDYSQIELRVLAHIAKDKLMIDAFNHDIDIHSATASQVFDVDIGEITSEMRRNAKAVNFGIVYGISEFGLSKSISASRNEAKKYIENYLNKYSGIKNFMENIVEQAKKDGYVTTLFGRRRYIDEINNKNKNIQKFGERVAMNAPIQGTAADIIKVAMNNVYYKLKELNMKSKLIMQVHDELILEIFNGEEDRVKEIVKEAMENSVITLDVPLKIDMNIGKSWYDAK